MEGNKNRLDIMKNLKHYRVLYFLVIVLTSCNKRANQYQPTFTISSETTHKIPENQSFTFGYLEVPEDRSKPEGSKVKLPVYIFKSRNPNPKKDPIIYTVGGPGSSTMRSAQYMNSYMYLDDRDFILFEQRGTQYAQPHLDCPEWAKAVYQSNLPNVDSNLSDELFAVAAKTCKTRLEAKGINLNQYNTNTIAKDIVDLKKALNIKSYNLLSLSYSTKIAQVLMRDHPEDIRSVVMDSPLPLEVNYDEESVTNLMDALDSLFSDCENNVDCSKAYPNLRSRFYKYLQDKTSTPLVVPVKNSNTGKEEIFYLTGKDLITFFITTSVSNIPYEINKLINNDISSVKAHLGYLFNKKGTGAGLGMRLSVWCAEEEPFNSEVKLNSEINKYKQLDGISSSVFSASICDIWSVKRASNRENQPIKSDIPVLIINGEYDKETPPKWGKNMTKNLSNSQHLIFKGWRHGPITNWSSKCAMEAANSFFNNPNKIVEVDCHKKIETPIFKLTE